MTVFQAPDGLQEANHDQNMPALQASQAERPLPTSTSKSVQNAHRGEACGTLAGPTNILRGLQARSAKCEAAHAG